jgi:hypothetical protein
VGRPEHLREATAKAAAAKGSNAMRGRPASGEKNGRKRMAILGAVYEAEPAVRIVCDFIHVLEYLWKAAWCFYEKGDPSGGGHQGFVARHASTVSRAGRDARWGEGSGEPAGTAAFLSVARARSALTADPARSR